MFPVVVFTDFVCIVETVRRLSVIPHWGFESYLVCGDGCARECKSERLDKINFVFTVYFYSCCDRGSRITVYGQHAPHACTESIPSDSAGAQHVIWSPSAASNLSTILKNTWK